MLNWATGSGCGLLYALLEHFRGRAVDDYENLSHVVLCPRRVINLARIALQIVSNQSFANNLTTALVQDAEYNKP
jgi:hypothetical protein